MPSPTEITVARLQRLVGTPDAPYLVDVRTDPDFDDDPRYLPGARRHRLDEIEALGAALRGSRTVVYCQRGRKISQGAAALLRTRGVPAETLEGGQFAWRDAGAALVSAAAVPAPDASTGATLWVTRQRPKIDRIACPWLVRRFIDPDARFLFVAPSEVPAVAERFGAEPFDVENVRFGHRGVDGERCTFDTMLEEFGLRTEALERLATVVRAADTDSHELAPEAAGLLAISVGLSRLHRDDLVQLDAGIALYDALYRWARDGFDEGHDWPPATARRSGHARDGS